MPKKVEKELKEKKTKNTVEKGKATGTKVVKKEKKDEKDEKAKTTATKSSTKSSTKSKTTTKKSTVKVAKKVTTKGKKPKISKENIEDAKKLVTEYLQEYYDLPYRYNETVVTILAQTPKRLFVYWDVSDNDKEAYKRAFGDDFFEKTYPVLLVHNEELNYTFEVPINDFANSWYLDIQDSKKNYVVKLGRKFKNINSVKNVDYEVIKQENINFQNDFIYITDSNKLEAPNDHILFETVPNQITYRNVKNGSEFKKNIKDLVNDSNATYSAEKIHELYTKLYSEEITREEFGRKNPGSGEFGLPGSSSNIRSSGQW